MTERHVQRLPLRRTAMTLIRELGSESNAHGVARIIRSRDKRRKVLWGLLVLLGVGSAVSQLSSLVHKYLQYQVVEVSEIQDGHPVEFPSVTLCNIEPISWRKLQALLNSTSSSSSSFSSSSSSTTSSSASSSVRDWLQFLETFDFGEQQAHLRSIRAFHENVGEEGVLHVRHSLSESLLHCRFNKRPCSTANFSTSFDGNYYSCFTFNAEDGRKRLIVHSTGPEHGLSVVMFLDNNHAPLGSYGLYTLDTPILHSGGARVMVHAPHTLPIPAQQGQDVAPGYSTSVAVRPVLHSRLARPYGNCSDSRLRGLASFTSTYSTCIAVCQQELIAQSCRCRSSALPHLPALSDLPYCGHVRRWRHMLRHAQALPRAQHLPQLRCELRALERLKNDRRYEAQCGCNHPCGELSYRMSTSMSYWPTELYQFHALGQLYGDTILKSPLGRAYSLHHSNIKDGEEILRQLSQHGQTNANATAAPSEEVMHSQGDNSSPPQSDGSHGGSSESSVSSLDTVSESSEARNDSSSRNWTFKNSSYSSKTRDVDGNKSSSQSQKHSSEGQQYRALRNSSRGHRNPHKQFQNNSRRKTGENDQQQQQPLLEYNSQQLDNLREASTVIRQNLLRLNVYLEDLSVVKYKQMPAYGMEDLFADIGGTLGLWMGVSVLTIMELLELVIRLSYLFFKAEWRPTDMFSQEAQLTSNTRSRSVGVNGSEVWELKTCSNTFSGKNYRGQTLKDRDWKDWDHSPFQERHADHRRDDDASHQDTENEENRRSKCYSYRTEQDYYDSDRMYVPRSVFDMNGHSLRETDKGSQDCHTRPSRASYWRLKRTKRKT
ncbi:FMRFamide-activated amiloride-sensitive sodium channel-like [Babylonia areolata]|uniref:FMRFamide-activated amiloride-sensitive sodium channel-like n=1 Tax=Babylonia areolata TaxID=304850 RepID=UPI003FD599FF